MILSIFEQKEVIVMKKRNGVFLGNAAALIAAAVSLLCYFDNSGGLPGGSGLSEKSVIPFSSVETAASEQSDQHVCNFQRYQEPLLDYPTEIWDTTGPEWEELPYHTADAISVDLYYKGFTEIDFCNAVKPDPYNNLGACEMRNVVYTSDGTHFQIEFTHVTNVGTWREVSIDYVFRAEHTGQLVDISSVCNPPDQDAIFEPMVSLAGTKLYGYSRKFEEGDTEMIDVSLFHSRRTGNTYSLAQIMPFETLDKIITCNDGEYYNPGFLSPFNPDGPNAILYPLSNPSDYELTVSYPDAEETKTYTFKIGSTYKEWVYSAYNTDGWRVDPKDNTRIISANGYYSLPADKKVTPSITAKAVS